MLYDMYTYKSLIKRQKRGFTIIELLVVVAIIVVLVAFLIPALGNAFGTAKSTKDKTQAKGIHSSMLLDSTSNYGQLPRPSVYAAGHTGVVHGTSDTTANLMSMMIAQNFFTTDLVISPVESNANVVDIDGEDQIGRASCRERV